MTPDGWRVADSDMHIFEPPDLWQRYMAPEWKHAALTTHGRNNQEPLMLLEPTEVAILVADIDMEAENYLVFFNLLKSKYPQILVLVLTSASDSELVIHLINEAQIYRFLNKPVNLSLMQQYLHSAIGRHAEYRSAPELLDRHRVRQSKSAEGAFGRGILDRLKTIKWPFVPARS